MRLPRIFKAKKNFLLIFFFFVVLIIGPARSKPVLAQYCPNNGCDAFYCLGRLPGSCIAEGGVADCPLFRGWRECIDGQWVETDKREPNLLDTLQINPYGESSLEKFQEALAECAATKEFSLECFVGGPEQMDQESPPGVVQNVANAITTGIAGPANRAYAQGAPPGVIASLGNMIAGLYSNPPATSTKYFAYIGRNLGIIAKPAYAQQGVGFIGLEPVLDIWRAFRNIAYLFFVVIFVFIGFAIMFRVKIDPQTVVTIQNALPRLVIALILVTFSYAIAGLLIDLIYVIISLIFAIFNTSLGGFDFNLQEVMGTSIFLSAWRILGEWQVLITTRNAIYEVINELFASVEGLAPIFGVAGGYLAALVIAIAIGFSLFKLFFQLLISYVSIILAVIVSPLILMFEAIPGQRGLGNWIRMLLSNIIPFPIVAGLLMIASALISAYETSGFWVAPFLGSLGTGVSGVLPALIGIGIILLTPSIVDQAKKAIGAPGIAAGVMAPISAAGGVLMAGPRALWTQTGGAVVEEARRARGEAIRGRLPGPDWLTGGEREPTK